MLKGAVIVLLAASAICSGYACHAAVLNTEKDDTAVCEGAIEAINASGPSITVGGVEIAIDGETRFLKEVNALGETESAKFSDIKKGDYVTVTGGADSSGAMTADSVTVKKDRPFDRFSTVTL